MYVVTERCFSSQSVNEDISHNYNIATVLKKSEQRYIKVKADTTTILLLY